MDLPKHCYRLRTAEVIRLGYWQLTFAGQSGISTWFDRPQRQTVIAPGRISMTEAVAFAKRRVPADWMLVGAVREGRGA